MDFELSYNGLRSRENHKMKSKITFGMGNNLELL